MVPTKPTPEAPIYYPMKQDPRLDNSGPSTPRIVFIQGNYQDSGPAAPAAPSGPPAPMPIVNLGRGGGSVKPGNIGRPGPINSGPPRQINPGPAGPGPRNINPQQAPRPRTINNPPPVNSNPIESQPIDTSPISVGGDVTPAPLNPQPLQIGELHPPKLEIGGPVNSTIPPPAAPPNPAPPADTSQDQYWQSVQVVSTTRPQANDQPQVELIPNTPVPWTGTQNSNGHFYQTVYAPKGVNWETARSFAVSRGGYLATVDSQAENTFVFGLVDDPKYWQVTSTSENAGPWIGGLRSGDDWQWANNNSKLGYAHWVVGEPSGISMTQDRLHFYSTSSFQRASYWDATNGGNLMLGFVVEYDKNPSVKKSRPSG